MMSPAEATSTKPYLVTMIKTSLKFLVSFSLFSILLPYVSFITISLKPSTFTLQIFSHGLDKSYMFLLCNGILVFLATNSGLVGATSSDVAGEHLVKYGTLRSPEKTETETEVVAVTEQEVAKGSVGIDREEGLDEDEDQGVDGVEEEGTELMSAEELNKKCDEFIKKMKQEIKLESQLVMVP